MRRYKVMLTRTYQVIIKAKNEERAKFLTEYFLGDCEDRSNERDRREKKFYIEEIELAQNDAFEAFPIRS